jgi:hypothetical protein
MAKCVQRSFEVLHSDEQLFRKIITADFRVLGHRVQLWNCHFPAKDRNETETEARAVGRLVKSKFPHLPQQAHLIVLGDFNMPSTDPNWAVMKEFMCPVSAQRTDQGLLWGTNFDGTKHYDDIWVGLQAHEGRDWGSNAQICIPHESIRDKGCEAYGIRAQLRCVPGVGTRSSEKVAAVYPDHRLIWAEFASAGDL